LKIPQDLTPVSVLCVGYANEVPAAPTRTAPKITWV
jgi:hypothetical protein